MKGAQRAFFETKSFDARGAKQCGPPLMKSDRYRLIGQCGHEGECRCHGIRARILRNIASFEEVGEGYPELCIPAKCISRATRHGRMA